MFTYNLLATGLPRQTPTRSRFACKYAGLEVVGGLRELRSNGAIRGIIKIQNRQQCMFTYNLPATGLPRQTPTRSRFACKYAGLEVVGGLRELRSNGAIRGIIKIQNRQQCMFTYNLPATGLPRQTRHEPRRT